MAITRALLAMCALAAIAAAVAYAGDTKAPPTICNVSVSDLASCLPAITGKNPPKPTPTCCSVMCRADLRCLCNYKAKFAQLGADPATALALPGKCGLKLPPKCGKKHMH